MGRRDKNRERRRKKHRTRRIKVICFLLLLVVVGVIGVRFVLNKGDSSGAEDTTVASESTTEIAAEKETEIASEASTEAATTETEAETEATDDWRLILVNAENTIPEDYAVELLELSNGNLVDTRIYPELQEMFNDARAEGLELFVREGYRTNEDQQELYDDRYASYIEEGKSEEEAKELTEQYVALPGTSEHELGIAVDINPEQDADDWDEVYEWLEENSYKYGFIKRYSEDKVSITGISNEEWHFRYVGAEAAQIMKEQNLCLEEYLALE